LIRVQIWKYLAPGFTGGFVPEDKYLYNPSGQFAAKTAAGSLRFQNSKTFPRPLK
jgi:hypothetical protein